MANPNETIKLVVDMGPSASNVKEVTKEVDALGHAATAAAGKPGAGGQGIQGVSYAVQDFASVLTGGGGIARALGAVTNNFDQLARAAGATVATAAKLSLAFTGFTAALPILIPLIEAMWKGMSAGPEGPEPVVKALDAAEERLKRIRGHLEEIQKAVPPEVQDTRKLVTEFLKFTPDLAGRLAQALIQEGRVKLTPAEIERTSGAARRRGPIGAMGPITGEQMAEIENRLAAAGRDTQENIVAEIVNRMAVEAAGKIVGRAAEEQGARETLRAMAEKIPGAFPKGFAGQLAELEPGVQAAREAAEQDEQIDAEARKERREARERRLAEVEKMRVEGGADLVPGLGGLGAALPLGERAAERAPAEAARRAREAEQAQLEARQRAAAADILRTEGVRMEPKEALQEVERRRRQAVQDQLDRNRELRAAEQGRQETGRPYNPDASIEALRQHNRDLRAAMERFTEATNDASGTSFAMTRILNARAGVLEGQSQMTGAPAYNFGKP